MIVNAEKEILLLKMRRERAKVLDTVVAISSV